MPFDDHTAELQDLQNALAQALFGCTTSEVLEQRSCVSCGLPATDFRDALSAKEYSISALCQACQDLIFGVSDELPTL